MDPCNSILASSLFYYGVVFAQHDMMEDTAQPAFNATGNEPMSYALLPEHKGYFYVHVIMMVIAFWILMPMGVMLGIAKSSLHVPVQLLAFCFAMVGFLFGKVYGHSTPHLYQSNSHHTLGWVMFWFLIIQMTIGIIRKVANAVRKPNHYQTVEQTDESSSSSCMSETSSETLHTSSFDFDKEAYKPETVTARLFNAVSPYIPKLIKGAFVTLAYNQFTKVFCRYYHMVMGRTFIILIFIQTLSGLVVYHGVCRSWEVLGCAAHLIKGGIFFFYGIMTFGRYLGAFADRGWAWNQIDDSDGGSSFSFEMIECVLIFVYGITNTWMEHFGQDSTWSHKDLEHASLAFMWWWCGVIGMLIESKRIGKLLQRTTTSSYSLNPFPALTVLVTGISMGNHHQDTEYSGNIHWMWGTLLSSAAVCRFITYITLYRNLPADCQPTRPPSELLGAFLLLAGSILFMASNSGTLDWLKENNVDSMFLMNVCVALTSITLCYVTSLQILKAWAEKREEVLKKQLDQFS
ncbi:hypothetical protein HPULCUR_007967 [Helicostylum pulchrum]|uniref:Integral membrane protein n=1 Tax=Helicostylum pulchrum TaxID=562976 RepID=A0ABP9Y695_9FUNG